MINKIVDLFAGMSNPSNQAPSETHSRGVTLMQLTELLTDFENEVDGIFHTIRIERLNLSSPTEHSLHAINARCDFALVYDVLINTPIGAKNLTRMIALSNLELHSMTDHSEFLAAKHHRVIAEFNKIVRRIQA